MSSIILASGAVILTGILSTVALRGRFDHYVAASIETRIEDLARTMTSARYGDGTWNLAAVERHGISALEDGFLLTLVAHDGSTIWDARTHNAGLCAAMVASMSDRMAGVGRDDSGSYSERTLPLIPAPASHGLNDRYLVDEARLVVGYWGPVYYRDADMDFIAALNRGLFAAAAVVVVLSALAGYLGAAGLAAPVHSAVMVARAVAAGDYSLRVKASSIAELDELGSALGNMAKTLEEQEELRKRLVIDASHEIRTPLASLRARLEGLADGVLPFSTSTVSECLADIARLTDLAQSLEGLAATEAAACEPRCAEVDLACLAKEVIGKFCAQAAAAGLVLELDCRDSPVVMADRILLMQVLENLVSNAVRYGVPQGQTGKGSVTAPQGSRASVRVRLEQAGSEAVFAVIDHGSGLEPQHLERIFERFYRVDPSRSRVTGGFGVGLAIARASARACGGEVYAFSDGPGSGSRFEFRMPADLHRESILG
jgi:signal transduction histidine kinase